MARNSRTDFDFRAPHEIGARINGAYDMNWVLSSQDGSLAVAASAEDAKTGRRLEVWTTEKGMQFYSGYALNDSLKDQFGRPLFPLAAFAFETQAHPDSVNKPDWPDTILRPTFSLGVVPPMFAQRLKVPILLWSQPEPDSKGGRLQNNSFCAANMNAHHMWRLGIPYFYVHAQAGTKDAEEGLMKQIRVAQAMKALGRMRIGLIGGRVPGFFTSCVDEMMLRRTLGHLTNHGYLTASRSSPHSAAT